MLRAESTRGFRRSYKSNRGITAGAAEAASLCRLFEGYKLMRPSRCRVVLWERLCRMGLAALYPSYGSGSNRDPPGPRPATSAPCALLGGRTAPAAPPTAHTPTRGGGG